MVFRKLYLVCLVLLSVPALGQTTVQELAQTPEKTGGVYYAYPTTTTNPTPAPKGYEPFYISHYGRHGSRYLIGDNDYKHMLDLLREASDAGALTPLGRDIMARLESVWIEADGRGGDLSPLGVRQHRGIAERMYRDYAPVFKGAVEIDASSTIVPRCILSMDAFCERLKELNPALLISRQANGRTTRLLNNHTEEAIAFRNSAEYKERYRKFELRHTDGERMVKAVFNDPDFVEGRVNPHDFIWGMYWLASDMQNMETDVSFYDVFTSGELFGIWQSFNYRFYVADASNSLNGGIMDANAAPLLRSMIEAANACIAGGDKGAAFRFGHDGNLIPLLSLLRFEGCTGDTNNPDEIYKVWADFKLVPMGSNIQIVFFRNSKTRDVIVKFLHNERETSIPVATDMFPFYRWTDVEAFYLEVLDELK